MGKGGGGSGGGSQTTKVVYPDWVNSAAKSNIAFANKVANLPYQPYTGDRIAGFSPNELAAQDLATQFATSGAGYGNLDAASGTAAGVMGYRPDSVVGNLGFYMNPYTQNVINSTLNNLDRSRQITLDQNAATAAKAGAFGGSRHGVVDAETNRNFFDVAGNTIAGLQNTAYNNALGAAQQDISNLYNANSQNLEGARMLANLGLTGRQLTQQDIDTLNSVGGQQRQMSQAELDQAYKDFVEQRDYPLRQLAIKQSALSNTPYGSTTTQSASAPQTNPFGAAAGGALLGSSLFGTGGALAGTLGTGFGAGSGALLGGGLGLLASFL